MNKRRKIPATSTEQGNSESAPPIGFGPNDPPKKNFMFLLGSTIAFVGWLAFLIWLAVVS